MLYLVIISDVTNEYLPEKNHKKIIEWNVIDLDSATQVATLMSDLMSSKNNLSAATDQLSEAERQTQQLLATLAQREEELNTTQHELSQVHGCV